MAAGIPRCAETWWHGEALAPILHVVRHREIDDTVAANNAVPQGLSSSICMTDLREAESFLAANGSDCGIANVDIGPSGAEIGSEKETAGRRESGSDAWKACMRRASDTVNQGRSSPLARGISFDI
jgi:aldehyde dehydrogenase (NAD+)